MHPPTQSLGFTLGEREQSCDIMMLSLCVCVCMCVSRVTSITDSCMNVMLFEAIPTEYYFNILQQALINMSIADSCEVGATAVSY